MNFFHHIRERFFRRPAPLREGANRAQRGRYGEDRAAEFCKRELRYKLITRNWFHKRDEIDLICMDGDVLVFIEVRARDQNALVSGYHSVNARKKKALQRVAKAYLNQLQSPPKHFRFDVVDVVLAENEHGAIRHYQNVPLFSKHYTP